MLSEENIKILIIGASSFIGKNLSSKLSTDSYLGTYLSKETPNSIKFNLKEDSIAKTLKDKNGFTHALILSAVSNPDACAKNPEYSNKVNVIQTKKLINELKDFNIIPVFASTEAVFDGEKGAYVEEDTPNPILLYGKQKREIEVYLEENFSKYVILRISRAFSSNFLDGTLLVSMLDQIKNNSKIVCASDQVMSPIHIDECSETILSIINSKEYGVFHVAGLEIKSRLEVLNTLLDEYKKKFNFSGSVTKCSLRDFNSIEKRPLDTSLCNKKIFELTKINYQPLSYYCKNIVDALE